MSAELNKIIACRMSRGTIFKNTYNTKGMEKHNFSRTADPNTDDFKICKKKIVLKQKCKEIEVIRKKKMNWLPSGEASSW